MIVSHDTHEVTLNNVGTVGEFKIRNSAKAFSILSSGLYSNKIKAIIRELSCNALDSHIGAGKADVPFEVHLPSVLEPWFSVRDFGMGLDNNQVINIYTTYFESTKTDSNDFIGALGLGSKSPFSYTNNFTVTAIKGGVKRIYCAFINDSGVPSIAKMDEEVTEEGDGVEVKFSVTDRYDYNSFRNEANGVFIWFEKQPNVIGNSSYTPGKISYKEQNIVPGVHVQQHQYDQKSVALMGNIAYPLDNIPEEEKHFGDLSTLLDCGLILEFGIGELDFAASREQLSYIPLTINSIRKKLELLNDNLASHLAVKADAIKDEWAKAEFLCTEYHTKLYGAAVKKYVADTKFELFDANSYHGRKCLQFTTPDLEKRGLSIKGFRTSHGSNHGLNDESIHLGGSNYVRGISIPVDMQTVIILNDLKTGCVARARYHYSTLSKSGNVYCISHNSTDLAIRELEYNKLISELHNPPTVIKASELSKRERTKPISTQGIAVLGLKSNHRAGSPEAYMWVPYTSEIDENETYYYVCLNNRDPIDKAGKPFNMFKIKALMDECGIKDITNIKIFGVRKNRFKELSQLDNWVWIEDIIKEEVTKVTDSHIASLIASEMLDNYYNKVYSNTTVAKYVGATSEYAKYVKDIGSIKRATGNVTQLIQLCSLYGNVIQLDAVKKKIQDAKDGLYKKYPLLKYFRDTSEVKEAEMADYIKLVDSSQRV